MKHATSDALQRLEPLLQEIRKHNDKHKELKEKKEGIFYCKGKAFLHFHEDAARLFADLRGRHTWERFEVTNLEAQARFLVALGNCFSE